MEDSVDVKIRVPRSAYKRLNSVLPWGTRQRVILTLLESFVALLESENGPQYLGLLMHGDLTAKDILDREAKA